MDAKTEKASIAGSGSARLAVVPEGRLSLIRMGHGAWGMEHGVNTKSFILRPLLCELGLLHSDF